MFEQVIKAGNIEIVGQWTWVLWWLISWELNNEVWEKRVKIKTREKVWSKSSECKVHVLFFPLFLTMWDNFTNEKVYYVSDT